MREPKLPDLPGIQTVLEQWPDAPDWLWNGLIVAASWEAAMWAWKNREDIRNRLEHIPKLTTVSMNPANLNAEASKLTAGVTADLSWNNYQTAGASADLRWKVEASTPSLTRRLEDLAAWYLHVS
jgi:hypothetical protein